MNQLTEMQAREELLRKTDAELERQTDETLAVLNDEERERVKDLRNEFRKRDENIPLVIRWENYRRNHEFLSQQIDERSHQIFTMGPLFVPISFLIFAYTVVNSIVAGTAYLLMVASLTCIYSWWFFYQRVQLLNKASYPHIFAYELLLGLSCHLTLKRFYKTSRFVRWTRHTFMLAVLILSLAWTSYLTYLGSVAFTDLPKLLGDSALLFACLAPTVISVILIVYLLVMGNMFEAESLRKPQEEKKLVSKEEVSSKLEAGTEDKEKPAADTTGGSQQPSTSGATPQTTTTD